MVVNKNVFRSQLHKYQFQMCLEEALYFCNDKSLMSLSLAGQLIKETLGHEINIH